ncbi:MAG: DNA recombination protein RmuC [Pseudomonadota bacterium]
MDLNKLSQSGPAPDSPAFWLFVIIALLVLAGMAFVILRASGADRAAARRYDAMLAKMDKILREEGSNSREESERRSRDLREEVRNQIEAVAGSLRGGLESNRNALDERLATASLSQSGATAALRTEVNTAIKAFGDSLKQDVDGLSRTLKERLGVFAESLGERQSLFERAINEKLTASTETISALGRGNAEAHLQLKQTVEERLEKLRADNELKLEQMRLTVDEKLQSTLEKRLGESFKHVSERLEHVHRGLGEMQTLATGVGDLKKVLSNVKDRGGWAEMQLGALLDQILAREQYVVNARINPHSSSLVEFAIRLPGGGDGTEVLLPIDSKFPKEDYERLEKAWEDGDSDLAKASLDALERILETEAKKIAEKYVCPPYSTDFAIMFLPTEGLFAEAMRRPGLHARLQTKHRVMVAGPTTLAALLNSLQMGFRTLAIQKSSSEVWRVLGEAKAEFEKYAQVWDKLSDQLRKAQDTVQAAGVRTRAVSRTLRDIESADSIEGETVLASLEFDQHLNKNIIVEKD